MFLLVLFLAFGNSVLDCSEVIGNYSDFNDKSCGIYRIPQELCFKWYIKLSSGLKDARNSLQGDALWSVLLRFKSCISTDCSQLMSDMCGGVLIADQWILTAAHCIENVRNGTITPKRYYVHLNPTVPNRYWQNTEYWSDEKYWHPLYKAPNGQQDSWENDIALLKLNKSVEIIPGIVNPICLPPEREFTLFEAERAVFSGFDTKSYESDDTPLINRLMISDWKVSSFTNLLPDYYLNKITPYPMANGSGFVWPGRLYATSLNREKVCEGDSGSPMWQYYQGRAVLIGIGSSIVKGNTWISSCMPWEYLAYFPNKTEITSTEIPLYLTWLPMKISWIKNITKLN